MSDNKLSQNPLSGINIPSLHDLVERAVYELRTGIVNLANPLQRSRLIGALESNLDFALRFQLQQAIEAATERAVKHVFDVMRDEDYQEKKRHSRERRAKERAEKRDKQKNAERESRMDYSHRNLAVVKVPKPTVQ